MFQFRGSDKDLPRVVVPFAQEVRTLAIVGRLITNVCKLMKNTFSIKLAYNKAMHGSIEFACLRNFFTHHFSDT